MCDFAALTADEDAPMDKAVAPIGAVADQKRWSRTSKTNLALALAQAECISGTAVARAYVALAHVLVETQHAIGKLELGSCIWLRLFCCRRCRRTLNG